MNEFIAAELQRIIDQIPRTDPATTDYHILLQSLECFAGIAEMIEAVQEQIGMEGRIIHVEFRTPQGGPLPSAESEEKAEEFPPEPESPFEEPKTEEPKPSKTYEMTEVRAALVEARKRGVNVTALLREYGVENFGAFPAGKYGELMDRLADE